MLQLEGKSELSIVHACDAAHLSRGGFTGISRSMRRGRLIPSCARRFWLVSFGDHGGIHSSSAAQTTVVQFGYGFHENDEASHYTVAKKGQDDTQATLSFVMER